MRTIHRYITAQYLGAFLIAMLVLSFVMSVALLFKVTELLARGASVETVRKFVFVGFPGTLAVSVPIAALVSALLIFGRLSADSEISAMRACGIPLSAIMRMPLLIAALLSLGCFYINSVVTPDSSAAKRSLRRQVGTADLLALLQPGARVSSFPGYNIYVGGRNGDELEDLWVVEQLKTGVRELKAKAANVEKIEDGSIRIDMRDVTIDPLQEGRPGAGRAQRAVRVIQDPNHKAKKDEVVKMRVKDYHTTDLIVRIWGADTNRITRARGADGRHHAEGAGLLDRLMRPDADQVLERIPKRYMATGEEGGGELSEIADISRKERCMMLTDLNTRIVLSLACLCFVAIGVPLGMKKSRKESSIGMAVCLAVAASFFLFVIAAKSLAKDPNLHPYFVPWIPVVICLVIFVKQVRANQ